MHYSDAVYHRNSRQTSHVDSPPSTFRFIYPITDSRRCNCNDYGWWIRSVDDRKWYQCWMRLRDDRKWWLNKHLDGWGHGLFTNVIFVPWKRREYHDELQNCRFCHLLLFTCTSQYWIYFAILFGIPLAKYIRSLLIFSRYSLRVIFVVVQNIIKLLIFHLVKNSM